MAWTEDRVATLTKLWADGLSASQIAKQLGGVTRNAVIGKVHRLGLSGRAKPTKPKTAAAAPRRAASKPAATRAAKPAASPKPAAVESKAKTAKSSEASRAQLTVPTEAPTEAKPLKDGSYATILTLTEHMCKWPIGDPTAEEFRFCGRKTEPEEPYCTPHSMVAYQPSRRRNSAGKMISVGPAPTSRKRIR